MAVTSPATTSASSSQSGQFKGVQADRLVGAERHEVAVQRLAKVLVGAAHVDDPNPCPLAQVVDDDLVGEEGLAGTGLGRNAAVVNNTAPKWMRSG